MGSLPAGVLFHNPSQFLNELIASGPDASTNLFVVSFLFKDTKMNPSIRAVDVTTPKKENRSVMVPFQNMDFPIMSPGASVDRTVSISLRIDENYDVLKLLDSHLCVDDNGYFIRDDNKSFICDLTLYAPMTSSHPYYKAIGSYKFNDCFLLSVPSIKYSYDNASHIVQNVTFMFSTYEHLFGSDIGDTLNSMLMAPFAK